MSRRLFPLWLFFSLLLACASGASAQQRETLPELIRRVKPAVVSVIT